MGSLVEELNGSARGSMRICNSWEMIMDVRDKLAAALKPKGKSIPLVKEGEKMR
jgi:hypothetical protein